MDGPYRLLVEGQTACFRRPEITGSLVTYDAMPFTVASKLLSTIYSPQGGFWQVDRIRVLKPIRMKWDEIRTMRGVKRVLALVDVAYVIEASIAGVLPDLAGHQRKFEDAFVRGKRRVHLGLADYDASVSMPTEVPLSCYAGTGAVDLGWMLYDFGEAAPARPRFFRVLMVDGVIQAPAELVS